jgi:cold shock CspA family protein
MAIEGTLTGSFNDRGFTFIEADPSADIGGDVFLHIGAIAEEEESRLYVRGARVEFDVVMVARGTEERPQARNVRLAQGTHVASSTPTISRTELRGTPKFWSPTGFGFIVDEDSGEEHFAGAASVPGGYLRAGDVVEFDVQTHEDGRIEAVNVRLLDWVTTDDPFADQLDMGHPRWTSQLADLAEPEHWNYQENPAKDKFAILRSYIKYTFLRLNELPDHVPVSVDGTHLSFNTGLVTPFQEQIFAVFRRRPAGEIGPPWILKTFEKASSVAFLQLFGGNPPPLAWYYDEPSQLVFVTGIPLSVNVEHVPHDPARFPEVLKNLSPHDLAALVNAKAPEAIERVRRNYKTAIPQFYRDGKSGQAKMQLLLPVALLRRDVVELALAVDRPASNVYLGRTVLTLDWAYNNARLLTRPDTDWLRP